MRTLLQQELALLYELNIRTGSGKAVRQMLERYKIAYRELGHEMAGCRLGCCAEMLCADSATEPDTCPVPEDSMLILKGFSKSRMDLLLDAMQRYEIEGIGYIAVLTPENKHWTLARLYAELSKERAELGIFRYYG